VTNGSFTPLAIPPVVTSRSPTSAYGGSNAGGLTFSGGIAGELIGGGVTTEKRATVSPLEITVRRPMR
jgi:hypothetical protein